MAPKTAYEVIIIGGGIAGISCALELHDSKVDYLVIDANQRIGGQLPDIDNTIRNYAGRFFQNGAELQDEMESQCNQIGINILCDTRIERIDLTKKELTAGATNYTAKALFLATGYRLRKLELPNYDELENGIIYDCEENELDLAGKRVAVIGGGDNALMDALWLAERCPHVLVVHRSKQFKARPDVLREVLANPRVSVLTDSEVTEAAGESGSIKSLTVSHKQTKSIAVHEVERIVVKIGYAPNTELFTPELTLENGHIKANATGETDIPGIFAGGDIVTPPYPRIARAAGQGVTAAGAIRAYLLTTYKPLV